jgi:hypothetical protein
VRAVLERRERLRSGCVVVRAEVRDANVVGDAQVGRAVSDALGVGLGRDGAAAIGRGGRERDESCARAHADDEGGTRARP